MQEYKNNHNADIISCLYSGSRTLIPVNTPISQAFMVKVKSQLTLFSEKYKQKKIFCSKSSRQIAW